MDDLYKLNARFNEAKSYKQRWLALYKELYQYVIPDRDAFNIFFNYNDVGKPTTNQVWDDTAVNAAYQRANDLHGLLLPKDRIWGRMALDPHVYGEKFVEKNQRVVDGMNDRAHFYLNQSNLSRVVSSSNLDLIGGTGAIWVESHDDFTPLYFRSIPSISLCIEYSTDDLLSTCWYGCKKSGRNIMEDFPNYNGGCIDAMKSNPNNTWIVVYGQIRKPDGRYYLYAVLESDPYYPLFEVERSYPQIIVYRDKVRPGEVEGRGVGTDMLPTIRDVNRLVRDHRKSFSFKALPPMFYDANAYFNPNSVRQWAGAFIARQPGGRNPLEALTMPNTPEIFQDIIHLQDTIKKGFQVDPLGEINDPAKSATEISIRENRAQRTSATDISRLINELPKQIWDVSLTILHERNLLLADRTSIPGFSPKMFRFDYVSPLFDIQNKEEVNNFVQNLQIHQQFYGEGAVLASTNAFEVNRWLAQKFNLPSKLFATDQEMKDFLKGAMQQQQQAALPAPSTGASDVNLPQSQGVTI